MITQITNIHKSTNLVTASTTVKSIINSEEQRHISPKNRVVTAIDNANLYNLVENENAINSDLIETLVDDNATEFNKVLYLNADIHKKFKYTMLLNSYISLIIDHKANACLVTLLKFLVKKNIRNALRYDEKFYNYLQNNPEIKEIVLEKYCYAVGCVTIYEVLLLAIEADDKYGVIKTFNILLKKFALQYVGNQYIGKYHNPIVYAIAQNKFDIFQLLVDMAPKYFVTIAENSITPLMVAAQSKNSKFLIHLLQYEIVSNGINYQNKDNYIALFLAMNAENHENVTILIDHAPLLVFEKLAGYTETILTTVFKKYPNYFPVIITNDVIASKINNPVFFSEVFCEKDNSLHSFLVELKNKIPVDKKQLSLNGNSIKQVDNLVTKALVDYKPKQKTFNIDYANVETCYMENLNIKMSSLLSSVLPQLDNLAIYIKTKQYYEDSNKINKVFSYGDENASIVLINWLVSFGVKNIKLIISPPDETTTNNRRYLSKTARRNYNEKKLFCLKKISYLLPEIKYDSIKSQNINYSGCKIHIGFVDDKRFMNSSFFNKNKVSIKKYNKDLELLKYKGPIIGFSAFEVYKELVADNLIIIKPFAFAKKCEQIHTDFHIDKKNKAISANIISLKNMSCSIIPETGENIELKYGSNNYILNWLTDKLAIIKNGNNIANAINIIQLFSKQEVIEHTIIYGLHHKNLSGLGCNIVSNWITILDSYRNNNKATIISIFPNNLLLDIDQLTYNRDDIIFLSLDKSDIIDNFKLAVEDKKIIIFTFPSLPKQIFQFVIKNSNLPMLTEGANTTSFLLQEGIPYLSLLPNYTTKVPYDIGDPLQSCLIEALSYKLNLNEYYLLELNDLYTLVKQKKFALAKTLLEDPEYKLRASFLAYLWEETNDYSRDQTKITVYKLIAKGKHLSSNAYNILLQALDGNLDSISSYIRRVITADTQENNHVEIIKDRLQNNFNNSVITSLYKFFKEKNITE